MTRIPDQTEIEVNFSVPIGVEQRNEVGKELAAAVASDYIAQGLSGVLSDMAGRSGGGAVRIEVKSPTRQDWSHTKEALHKLAAKHGCEIEVEFDGRRLKS